MTSMAECPCCHGMRSLRVIDFYEIAGAQFRTESFTSCCHCEGTGEIATELTPSISSIHLTSMEGQSNVSPSTKNLD